VNKLYGSLPELTTLHTARSTAKRTANPRDSWPSWCDDHSWAPESDGPAPSWEATRFEPTPVSEAFYTAFQLGLAGEDPALPDEFPADPADGPTNRAFLGGLAAGRYTLQKERDAIMGQWVIDEEFEAWVSDRERAADAFDLMNPNEIIEARGHHSSTPSDL
jgi:hypothetical protein